MEKPEIKKILIEYTEFIEQKYAPDFNETIHEMVSDYLKEKFKSTGS